MFFIESISDSLLSFIINVSRVSFNEDEDNPSIVVMEFFDTSKYFNSEKCSKFSIFSVCSRRHELDFSC